jgi:hypothetical protein
MIDLEKHSTNSWYRLLKVIYTISFVAVIIITIVLTVFTMRQNLDNHQYGIDKYYEYQNLESEQFKNITKLGQELSNQGANIDGQSDYEKGRNVYNQLQKKLANSLTFTDSDGELWQLLDDTVTAYERARKVQNEITTSYIKELPKEVDNGTPFKYGILALVCEIFIFWLIRRIYFYVILKDDFFRL